MSSASEKISSPMDELLAMQQSALQANLNKASNIQKAVTLTEANWMGLTRAMELTGNSILKAQETLEHLPTTQEMNTLLAGQAGNLTQAHTEAVQQIQKTVQELLPGDGVSHGLIDLHGEPHLPALPSGSNFVLRLGGTGDHLLTLWLTDG